MKKSLLLGLILLSGILLTGCGKNVEESNVDNQNLNNETSNVNNEESLNNALVSETTPLDCEKVIQNYLDGADTQGQGDEIKLGDNIIVDYIGRLEDGTVFDTSIESIAKACGKYDESRDYTQGLSFEVGAGQMIKGFDNGVIGMKLGQTKTVKFGPKEGYGQINEEYILTYTQDEIGDLSAYSVGDNFQPNPYVAGVITKVTDKEIVVDFNHELAGKDLIFDITIKSIN